MACVKGDSRAVVDEPEGVIVRSTVWLRQSELV